MAEFRFDQVTPGAGVAGRARHDLVAGEVITMVATTPAPGAGVSYTWEILDKVGSIATLSATTGTTVTLQPFGAIVAPCTFKVRFTANDNGIITSVDRVCSVRFTVTGLRHVLFAETADALDTLTANTSDDSTDNALYPNRAGLGASEQNWRGTAEAHYELLEYIESLAAGGSPQLLGNLKLQEIDDTLLATEVKLGGFAFNPSLFEARVSMYLVSTGTLVDGGTTAPSFDLRLYDMGTPSTPQAGDLRATVTVSVTGSLRRDRILLTPVVALTPTAGEILNVERVYEVRGYLTGDAGDRMEIDWAGIQGG